MDVRHHSTCRFPVRSPDISASPETISPQHSFTMPLKWLLESIRSKAALGATAGGSGVSVQGTHLTHNQNPNRRVSHPSEKVTGSRRSDRRASANSERSRKARLNLITISFVRDTFSCASGDKGSCEGHPTSGLLPRTGGITAKRPHYHTETAFPLPPMRKSKTAGTHRHRIHAPFPTKTKYHANTLFIPSILLPYFFTESL